MKTWIKLYTKIVDDFDQGTLSWAQRGIWSAMLALCGKIDDRDLDGNETGLLDTPESVAWSLRLTAEELDDAMQAFGARGMAEIRDGIIWLPRYSDRQGHKPSDEPERVAARVKRHRSSAQNVTPCNADETPLKRPVTRPDTDTDTERDADTDSAAQAPQAPKRPSRADSRSNTPAIQCARALNNGKYPPRQLYDAIISVLGSVPDGERAAACRQAWLSRGYNPNAWTWLLEWYRDGIPKNGKARASPGAQAESVIDEWLKEQGEGVT